MRAVRSVSLVVAMALAIACGAVALVTPLPYVETTAQQVSAPPQVAKELPPVFYGQPATCLSKLPRHDYAGHKVDRSKAGPGSNYKESQNAQGPSAVPVDVETLSPAERVKAFKVIYHQRLCGGKKFGGDKKLFQVAFVSSDLANLTVGPTHRHMNPNMGISRAEWIEGLDAYLATIRWDMTYLKHEKLPGKVWTTSMVSRPGQEPLVRLVHREQPKSWYVYLAQTQPDGSVKTVRKRLNCNAQDTWLTYKDVPQAFKLMMNS
jgi:hypothetical protein